MGPNNPLSGREAQEILITALLSTFGLPFLRKQRASLPRTAMTKKEFIALEKKLLPYLPGFAISGRLTFISPVGHTLRGFGFDPSGFDKKGLYVTLFFLPLCVPSKYLTYGFGKRLKGTGWRADEPGLENQLIAAMQKDVPFLKSLSTPRDVLEAVKSQERNFHDPYKYEAIAYLLIRVGEPTAGIGALDDLLSVLDLSIAWQSEMAERASALKSMLVRNPSDAQKQLEAWEAESIRNLGLENFR
jgi:hypothetical protein